MSRNFRTPVSDMNPHQKEWFATAIVSMVLADGEVSKDEVDSLVNSLAFLKNDQLVETLKRYVHYQQAPTLTAFVGWEKRIKDRAYMMLDLMDVAIADRDFSSKEKVQFLYIGKLLGFPGRKVDELIAMGDKSISDDGNDPDVII